MGTENVVPFADPADDREARLAEILNKMRVLFTEEGQQAERDDSVVVELPRDKPVDEPAVHARAPATGGRELFPPAVVGRLMAGHSPVQVFREHRGITREALAQIAGISVEALAALEAGPDMVLLRKIAEALTIGVGNLR